MSILVKSILIPGPIVDEIDITNSLPDNYYFVSKNKDFNNLNLEGKTVVAQYEFKDELKNAYSATTYYYRIVRDGEVYPGSFGNWDEINCEVHPIDESSLDMFDNLRFGARFKTRSGIGAIFLFKNICHNRCFLNFVIDKKTRDELYLEQIVTDSKGFVDNPNHPCDNYIVERIY